MQDLCFRPYGGEKKRPHCSTRTPSQSKITSSNWSMGNRLTDLGRLRAGSMRRSVHVGGVGSARAKRSQPAPQVARAS